MISVLDTEDHEKVSALSSCSGFQHSLIYRYLTFPCEMHLQTSPSPNIWLTTDLTFLAYLEQSREHWLDTAAIP